jgi:hypothetical protein
METCGQHLGFSLVHVALRAGHDPSVPAMNYTGNIEQADRALASAVAVPSGHRSTCVEFVTSPCTRRPAFRPPFRLAVRDEDCTSPRPSP